MFKIHSLFCRLSGCKRSMCCPHQKADNTDVLYRILRLLSTLDRSAVPWYIIPHMTIKDLQKPVVMTIAIAAFAVLAFTFMPHSIEAAPASPYTVVPGYTAPGYKRPFLFNPGYRPMPMPYSQIFRYIR